MLLSVDKFKMLRFFKLGDVLGWPVGVAVKETASVVADLTGFFSLNSFFYLKQIIYLDKHDLLINKK